MAIEVTFRDLYKTGDDTVILEGRAERGYRKARDKDRFLRNLETVSFEAPYVVREKELDT